MISKNLLKDLLIVLGMSIALTIFIPKPGFSQDTTKNKAHTKVMITAKIISDSNGKKQEFDTTINIDHSLKPGEQNDIITKFEKKFKDHSDMMNELEVEMHDLKLPDSGFMDSVQALTENAMKMHGGMNLRFRHNAPRAFTFDYDFDNPDQPRIEEFNDENSFGNSFPEPNFRSHEKDQSLNDLLGDIPMNMVKSYSIKETKDGKKITIELKNGPIIENHKEVIIIHSPRQGRSGHGNRPQIRKRVIIRDGSQGTED